MGSSLPINQEFSEEAILSFLARIAPLVLFWLSNENVLRWCGQE
jgi:hypothetical protein